jgi:hypothetical protein
MHTIFFIYAVCLCRCVYPPFVFLFVVPAGNVPEPGSFKEQFHEMQKLKGAVCINGTATAADAKRRMVARGLSAKCAKDGDKRVSLVTRKTGSSVAAPKTLEELKKSRSQKK